MRACWAHFGWVAVFSALANLLYLTPPLYMMQVYDRVVPTGSLTTLGLVSVAAVLALAALAALDWLRGRLLLRAALRLDHRLAGLILARLAGGASAPMGGQALREFDHVRAGLTGPAAVSLFDAPWTPLYVGCCFLLHPLLGALTVAGGAVLFGLAWLNERRNRARLGQALQSAAAAYAAHEAMAGQAEVVRAMGMRRASIARQLRLRRTGVDQHIRAQFAGGGYAGLIKFVRLFLQSAALGLSAVLVVQGRMSPGAIIASSVLLSRAVAPIELLVSGWPALVQARASWRTLEDLLARTDRQDRPRTALPAPAGRLSLEGVTVRLDEGRPPPLRDVSLELGPGCVLGVVGPSGSGKTTLARIVSGALSPSSGTVRLDGAEYDARDGDDLARHIGYLPQTPSLFAGSIRDNIARFSGEDEAAAAGEIDRAVVAAARAAGCHEMILRTPDGYDTVLGHGGTGVSAGQAQRIALARALFRAPVLLVLDEPNSNLDAEGEAALMAAIGAAKGWGAAVVVVAHRAGVLAGVDRLMVLRDGAVEAEGEREAVLAALRSAPDPASGEGAASRRAARR